jgi:hypothetical protein
MAIRWRKANSVCRIVAWWIEIGAPVSPSGRGCAQIVPPDCQPDLDSGSVREAGGQSDDEVVIGINGPLLDGNHVDHRRGNEELRDL